MNKKSYEVDIDSIDDCTRLLKIAQGLIGQLRVNKHGTRNEQSRAIFDACMAIYHTDISSVYSEIELDKTPVYYVYIHADPNNKIVLGGHGRTGKVAFAAATGMWYLPFYVGKRVGNRAYELNRNDTHRKVRQKLHKFNKEIEVQIIQDGLTEVEALMLESKLIDIFGLISMSGKLVNLDEGINSKDRRGLYKTALSTLHPLHRNSV